MKKRMPLTATAAGTLERGQLPDRRVDGLRVLLLVPPYRTTDELNTWLYPLPYAAVMLAAVLRQAGAHVALKDFLQVPQLQRVRAEPPPSFAGKSAPTYWHFGVPMDDCMAWLDEHVPQYDVVGLCYQQCNLYETSQAFAQRVRQLGVPLVVGGSYASTAPEQVQAQSQAQVLVRNEGENVVVEAMERAAGGWQGTIQGTLADLEELPLPAWDLAPPDRYPTYQGKVRGVLAVSRGCPWDCTFCSVWTVMSRKHRRLSRERAYQELRHLWDLGVRYYSFVDDNLFISKASVEHVLGAIEDLRVYDPKAKRAKFYVEEGIEIRIAAEPGFIRRIADAGFDHVAVGLETMNDEVRAAVRKPYVREQMLAAVAQCREAGVTTKAFYIIGLPTDTLASVCADMVAFGRLGLDARPNNLKLYPATEAYNAYHQQGAVDETYDWRLGTFWTPTNSQGLDYATMKKLKTVLGGIGHAAATWGVRVFEDTLEEAVAKVNAKGKKHRLDIGYNGWLVYNGNVWRATPYRTLLELLLLAHGAAGAQSWQHLDRIYAEPLLHPRTPIQEGLVAALRGEAAPRQASLFEDAAA